MIKREPQIKRIYCEIKYTKIVAYYRKSTYLCTRKHDGAIAQLVEQRTENPCVPGSIPGGTTENQAVTIKCSCFFCIPKWPESSKPDSNTELLVLLRTCVSVVNPMSAIVRCVCYMSRILLACGIRDNSYL